VILNTAFGTNGSATDPFNLGRSATHEIGHFFNLRHIWGDNPICAGSDFVDDTPNAEAPNFGKPTFPHVSCNNGPNGDMFMNYMDYSDDDSMFMFTPGQVARMHTTLDGPRKGLVG
jgi:hypothetical protein